MILRVYLHRTKKHEFEVADAFEVKVDLENLPEDKKEDLDYINLGFKNGNEKVYFDNKEMLFMKRKPKRTRKKKVEEPVDEQEKK